MGDQEPAAVTSDRAPVPKLRREAIIPILPRQWLWSYLLIKVMVVSMAIATMSLIAR
jgi:hypothetical protein